LGEEFKGKSGGDELVKLLGADESENVEHEGKEPKREREKAE